MLTTWAVSGLANSSGCGLGMLVGAALLKISVRRFSACSWSLFIFGAMTCDGFFNASISSLAVITTFQLVLP